MREMKVLWLANIPSPYRVKFFNELGKYCELMVLFEKKSSSERDDSWKKFKTDNFKAVFLKGKSVGVAEAFCPSIIKYLNKEYNHIVVTNYSDPTGILAILWMKLQRIPYEIEGDGAFPGKNIGIKTKIKAFLLQGATRCFSTAKLHDVYYMQCGVKKEKIVRYPFTSISEKDLLENPVSDKEKQIIREKLDMKEKRIVLAVGQFIQRKGLDILIKAFNGVDKNFGLYIVGGKAPEQYISLAEGRDNIHFVDFMQPKVLKEYYMAADVFVHPTREDIWGLVINEAMANGLPVVTTDKCIAGLEMVMNNKNGYIVPVENVEKIRQAVNDCIINRDAFCKRVLRTAKNYTTEKMADAHMNAWRN